MVSWKLFLANIYFASVYHRLVGTVEKPDLPSNVYCHVDGSISTSNVNVLHQGPCGKCSNEQDIQVYRDTAQSLTGYTTACATVYLIGGRWLATECMKRVGLSHDCQECWMDNIECTAKMCTKVCLHHVLTSRLQGKEISSTDKQFTLNPCLQCDEENCGPSFKLCAGANRRNSGIVSDISRPESEIYKSD